ncbi:MAG: energy-coupling factor ABC transporter ATP-binding protein [Bacteroidetes bacterium]|nr:energy-coupling factor ABC transporter ATP-binding protein [Bacteroidota bacterium]MBU1719744.1 energy-coupling factor ABC transporter ATP-binding protein [Bacteroidota bacterium]
MEDIIRIAQVSFQYTKQQPALVDIDFSVKKGEIFAILGSNGSGKSTLLNIIGGLTYPTTGQYFFQGNEVSADALKNKSFNAWFRENLGFIFQNPDSQLFCPTVMDELLFGPLQLGKSQAEATQRTDEVLEMLELTHLSARSSHTLSSGEKKRVAIGAILTMNPSVLIIDEPMAGLDPKSQSYITELLIRLNEAGKTIIISTHSLALADYLKPRIAVLSEEHRLVRTGLAEEILPDTDFLTGVNLIHAHLHRHGKELHKHIHPQFLFHRHDGE